MLFSHKNLKLPILFLLFAVSAIGAVQFSAMANESAESSTIENSESITGEGKQFSGLIPIGILGGVNSPGNQPTLLGGVNSPGNQPT